MASGQHFKVLKGKKTDKSKVADKKAFDETFDNIFRKKDYEKIETIKINKGN